MSEPEIVGALEALGYNKNEGRAYAALLALGPATGYEVSQHAGVPRSAVYSVLRKLVAEGAAKRTAGPPERFTAIAPDDLCAQLEKRLQTSTRALKDAASRLDAAGPTPDAHSVQGYERILEVATSIIAKAGRTLVISGWPREIALLDGEINAAAGRGVFTVLFSHAELPASVAGIRFSYGLAEAELEAFWRHRLVVIADDHRSLLGATEKSAQDRAVVSDTAAIAEVATSQIALDITLLSQRMKHDAGPVLAKILGDRIGRLDTLDARSGAIEVGANVTAKEATKARKKASHGSNRRGDA